MKMMRWTRSCGGEVNELRSRGEEEEVVVVKVWLKMTGRSN